MTDSSIKPPILPILTDRMRELAKTHPRGPELSEAARDFDLARLAYNGTCPPLITVEDFLGAWSRARMLWCECTGEPII